MASLETAQAPGGESPGLMHVAAELPKQGGVKSADMKRQITLTCVSGYRVYGFLLPICGNCDRIYLLR